jgi:hypothetical protein
MRLSEERIAHVARAITNSLLDDELIDLEIDEARFVQLIEMLIVQDLKIEDAIDEDATAWLKTHKPNLEEGSTEWEIQMDRVKEDLAVSRGYVIR